MQNAAAEQKGVFWYGRLPYEQTLALERQCDIMLATYDPVIPNHRCAAPNKLYESLMLGKPVLMCIGTGWDELILGEGIGELADCTEQGFAQGLDRLCQQRSRWEEMGSTGRACYARDYSWQIMKQRLWRTYAMFE